MNSHWKKFFKKILITLLVVGVYQLGCAILLPGLSKQVISQQSNVALRMFFSGGTTMFSVFAVGLGAYITATMLTQVLSSAQGTFFHKLKKDRNFGAAKLNSITKGITIIVAVIQAVHALRNILSLQGNIQVIYTGKIFFYAINIPAIVAGSLLAVWLANQISKKGMGKGIQVMLFVGLLSRTPAALEKFINLWRQGLLLPKHIMVIAAVFTLITLFVIFMEGCVRKIKINYPALRIEEQKYLPIKLNYGGVFSVILANHVMSFIPVIAGVLRRFLFTGSIDSFSALLHHHSWVRYLVKALLICFFTITYSSVVFDPDITATELHNAGKIIEGVPPTDPTAAVLHRITGSLNILASIYLIFLCLGTELVCVWINSWIGIEVINIGGSSILMCVGIADALLSGIKAYNYQSIVEEFRPGSPRGNDRTTQDVKNA